MYGVGIDSALVVDSSRLLQDVEGGYFGCFLVEFCLLGDFFVCGYLIFGPLALYSFLC